MYIMYSSLCGKFSEGVLSGGGGSKGYKNF